MHEFLEENALTIDQHRKVKNYCEKINIDYLCTPFSLKAAHELITIGVEFFKIGSGEMTDTQRFQLLQYGLAMIVSTGMSTFDEIDRTYNLLIKNIPIALMNCTSEYPPIYEDINLKVIPLMHLKSDNRTLIIQVI